jgi:hypothetical protein
MKEINLLIMQWMSFRMTHNDGFQVYPRCLQRARPRVRIKSVTICANVLQTGGTFKPVIMRHS